MDVSWVVVDVPGSVDGVNVGPPAGNEVVDVRGGALGSTPLPDIEMLWLTSPTWMVVEELSGPAAVGVNV